LKRLLTILATLLMVIGLCAHLAAQRKTDVVAVPFSGTPYRVGERLSYNVSFSNFVTAAHVELFVAARGMFFNRDGLQLRAHVETTGVVNAALYSINNDYISYLDPNNGLPYRTQQVIREGGRTADTSSDYNVAAGTAAIPAKLRVGEFPGTYDLLSALYRLRALPLTPGSRYLFNVQNDRDQYAAELRVMGREMVKTNVGSFSAIVTQVRVPGSDADKYRIRIYFSDDERHVPVLMTAQLAAGEIRAELAASELPEVAPPTVTGTPTPNIAVQPPNTPPVAPSSPPTTNTPRNNSNASGDSAAANSSLPANLPFNIGEQLNYTMVLSPANQAFGTLSLQVRARAKYFGRDGLLLAGKAQTVGAAQRIVIVNDQINSYVDVATLVPFRTEVQMQEGRRRVNQTFTIDQTRGTASTDKGVRIEIPVGTHDFISVFYALRSFNLAPPKRNAVSLLVNNRALTLFITSLKREVIELGTQKIPAVQLSLTTDDPQPDKYAIRIWVSEDQRRLPLRITATTPVGPIRADLAIIPVVGQ
jgi:hypothetical protein